VRVIVKFNSSNQYVNLEADEFHEDSGFIKVFKGNELVGIFALEEVKRAYRTEMHFK
jgi:hypothetical protein